MLCSFILATMVVGGAGAQVEPFEPIVIPSNESPSTSGRYDLEDTSIDIDDSGVNNFSMSGYYDYGENRGMVTIDPAAGTQFAGEPLLAGNAAVLFEPGAVIDDDHTYNNLVFMFNRNAASSVDNYNGFFNQRGFIGVRIDGDSEPRYACLQAEIIARGELSVEMRGGLYATVDEQPVTCPEFADGIHVDRFRSE